MNIPIKNITKVDTSKGVPVWITCMNDIRCYVDCYIDTKSKKDLNFDASPERKIVLTGEMKEIVDIMKLNFTNNNELGNNTILLSLACINFLSMSVTSKIGRSFVKHVFFHKFAGIAYTGPNTQKVITLTSESTVPTMLPFVLHDFDRIIGGYGVYRYSINHHKLPNKWIPNNEEHERDTEFLYGKSAAEVEATLQGLEKMKNTADSEATAAQMLTRTLHTMVPQKGDTLYHGYDMWDLSKKALLEKRSIRTYHLCTMSRYAAFDLKISGVKLATTPILTIETQNNTLVSFKDAATVLPFSVRRANAEGVVATVYATETHKRPREVCKIHEGGVECEIITKKTKNTVSLAPQVEGQTTTPTEAEEINKNLFVLRTSARSYITNKPVKETIAVSADSELKDAELFFASNNDRILKSIEEPEIYKHIIKTLKVLTFDKADPKQDPSPDERMNIIDKEHDWSDLQKNIPNVSAKEFSAELFRTNEILNTYFAIAAKAAPKKKKV